jgi:DNA primase
MAIFSKESLETLRQRVNLVEVLNSHLELKASGAAYKALCPFHDEKSPSFTVQKGDTHYHCFGCGAHGDAIQFLMNHSKMSFLEAVESLAQRFHVHLETIEGTEEKKGPNKALLKQALDIACNLYHFLLLHTLEGHEALKYLYSRGLDLDFIRQFRLGLAPKQQGVIRKTLHSKGLSDEIVLSAGLLSQTKDGGFRDFFSDRITFPIHDTSGAVIGFSARKYKEDTFGGKYINTFETVLFKKSKVLFGFNYSRRRIAKERKAIIVEGQIDALKLIQAGFNITVAGQGTAFGEGHVKEVASLGLNQVYLALDADNAGQEAASKIGNLFQREGIEVRVVSLPPGSDPDSFLKENGAEGFLKLLNNSVDYLTFLVRHLSKNLNMESPAGKNEIVQMIVKQIRQWDHPLMVHESLRKIAHLMQVPEAIIGVGQEHTPNIFIKKSASVALTTIDPDRIIESDFLRWLLLMSETQPQFITLAKANISPENFHVTACRHIYKTFIERFDIGKTMDLLSLAIEMDDGEGQMVMSELLQKKVNKERAEQQFIETIQKILDRNWMELREAIKMKIQSGDCAEDEVLALVKEFDELRRNPPKIKENTLDPANET